MNTTSMEFVLAQERVSASEDAASASEGDSGALTRDPAPLVLSEFMGITSAMSDALLVNPWDLGGVAAAVDRGVKMSSEEKRTRHKALLNAVRTHTSRTWAASLVRMLLERGGGAGEDMAHATPYLDVKKMESMYRKAGKRLFLFDYDVRDFLLPVSFFFCFPFSSVFVYLYLEADSNTPFHRIFV